ncbi:MAG: serine hydrolase, partial [Candidatus Binatia bacterium]
ADLAHLSASTDALRRAQTSLGVAALLASRARRGDIQRIEATLSAVARRMAGDVLRVATGAGGARGRLAVARRLLGLGDFAAAQGNGVIAVGLFGSALDLAANTITFDVALFEANIAAMLGNQTVGHAFSIAYLGQLYQDGESAGLARTAADAPATAQSPSKEMHVASVSKTLTTIVTLRLLEESGLTPEALIAPYLPGNWVLGDGVDQLRFRHFMTHTSGFGQIDAGNSYEALRTAIATDVGSQSFSYKNANFGLMRVLAAGLQGIDPVDYGEFDAGTLTTAAFLLYAQFLYDSIGVEVGCAPNDATPTLQYRFPDDGTAGYVEPDRQLSCGGFGWFISSDELAAVLSHLRHTETLLSASARGAMQEDFLGFMDPANYSFIGGTFGVYSMHGGDWRHGGRELHSCVVAFPIAVEVALVINSARGVMPYQCTLLQSAFDDAWVAN